MQPYGDMEAINVSMLEYMYGSSNSSLHQQIVEQYDSLYSLLLYKLLCLMRI